MIKFMVNLALILILVKEFKKQLGVFSFNLLTVSTINLLLGVVNTVKGILIIVGVKSVDEVYILNIIIALLMSCICILFIKMCDKVKLPINSKEFALILSTLKVLTLTIVISISILFIKAPLSVVCLIIPIVMLVKNIACIKKTT